ncbi:hypothetical protein MCEMAEM4_03329 [Burkholderiaceae bacterium]
MFKVDATNPPTFTEAPDPNKMPLGLTKNTWPLDVSRPRTADGSVPVTRFKTTELLLGWMNCTDSPTLMPKLCQLIAARAVVWVMVI